MEKTFEQELMERLGRLLYRWVLPIIIVAIPPLWLWLIDGSFTVLIHPPFIALTLVSTVACLLIWVLKHKITRKLAVDVRLLRGLGCVAVIIFVVYLMWSLGLMMYAVPPSGVVIGIGLGFTWLALLVWMVWLFVGIHTGRTTTSLIALSFLCYLMIAYERMLEWTPPLAVGELFTTWLVPVYPPAIFLVVLAACKKL